MSILKIILIMIIIYIVWKMFFRRESLISSGSDLYYEYGDIPYSQKDAQKYYNDIKNMGKLSYTEKIKVDELDEETVDAHYRDMVKQLPIFSSGAGYSIVEEDSTSPVFTNYTAFSRPEYVEILPNPRQIPSEDINVLKENNRRNVMDLIPMKKY